MAGITVAMLEIAEVRTGLSPLGFGLAPARQDFVRRAAVPWEQT